MQEEKFRRIFYFSVSFLAFAIVRWQKKNKMDDLEKEPYRKKYFTTSETLRRIQVKILKEFIFSLLFFILHLSL